MCVRVCVCVCVCVCRSTTCWTRSSWREWCWRPTSYTSCRCTHTRTYTHAHTHARTHSHTRTPSSSLPMWHTFANTHTQSSTPLHTQFKACVCVCVSRSSPIRRSFTRRRKRCHSPPAGVCVCVSAYVCVYMFTHVTVRVTCVCMYVCTCGHLPGAASVKSPEGSPTFYFPPTTAKSEPRAALGGHKCVCVCVCEVGTSCVRVCVRALHGCVCVRALTPSSDGAGA